MIVNTIRAAFGIVVVGILDLWCQPVGKGSDGEQGFIGMANDSGLHN